MIFDIIVVIIFIVCLVSGYKKGLIRQLLGVFSLICSYFVSTMYSTPFGAFLYTKLDVESLLYKGITDTISGLEFSGSAESMRTALYTQMESTGLSKFIDFESLTDWSLTEVFQGNDISEKIVDVLYSMASTYTLNVLEIVSTVILFIGAYFILSMVFGIVGNMVTGVKVIGGLDSLGGACIGACIGLIICISVGYCCVELEPFISDITAVIDGSIVLESANEIMEW